MNNNLISQSLWMIKKYKDKEYNKKININKFKSN